MAKLKSNADKPGGKRGGSGKKTGGASTKKSDRTSRGAGKVEASTMAAPASDTPTPPPPFIYFVSAENFGAFIWDGSTGGALYVDTRCTVCRPMKYWRTVVANGFTYYYFAEAKQTAGTKTRIWQFEAPGQGKQFLLVTYYDSATNDPPTAFGDAVYRTLPP